MRDLRRGEEKAKPSSSLNRLIIWKCTPYWNRAVVRGDTLPRPLSILNLVKLGTHTTRAYTGPIQGIKGSDTSACLSPPQVFSVPRWRLDEQGRTGNSKPFHLWNLYWKPSLQKAMGMTIRGTKYR